MTSQRERVEHSHVEVPAGRRTKGLLTGDGHGSLNGEDFADMRPALDLRATIKGVIAPNSLVGIIGASGCGKTFLAVDMACRIAAGTTWRSRKVELGLVVYCALEGGASARNRFAAWRARFLADRSDNLPLRAMTETVNLRDPADQARLIEFIRAAEVAHGRAISTVFIDTLSRAMAGGDENGPADMGALIGGADAIRTATGATVVLIHHLGKDRSKGARGHGSLRAALDTEIEVDGAGPARVARVTKQRDWPDGEKFGFTLEVVKLGTDCDGDPVTSCIVQPCDEVYEMKPALRGKAQRQLLNALRGRSEPGRIWTPAEIRAVARELGQVKGTARSAAEALSFSPYMTPTLGGYRLAGEKVEGLKGVDSIQPHAGIEGCGG